MRSRTALITGALFITATVANVIGVALSKSLLNAPDYLASVSVHADRVAVGAFLELVAAGACVGIAIALYPVLKPWGGSFALGSVVFRAVETVMYLIAAMALLSLLALGNRFAAGAADPASYRAVGDSLLDVRQQAALMAVFAFSVGGFLYYCLFYRSRLIPRWLSGWGIGAAVLMFVACVLALFQQNEITAYAVLAVPIGVQEMVLAVWLIAKGFNAPETQSVRPAEPQLVAVGR